MTAPAGVVDLSLPDYPTLVARAGVNPRAEAARVAGADPGTVAGSGALLGRAGGEMDGAYTRSLGAADTLGRAFTNAGAPVLDRVTHVGNLPASPNPASRFPTCVARSSTGAPALVNARPSVSAAPRLRV